MTTANLNKVIDNNLSAFRSWSALSFQEADDNLNNSNRELIAAYLEAYPNAKGYKSWSGIVDPPTCELYNFCMDIIFDGNAETVAAIESEPDALKCLELAEAAHGQYLIWS